MGKLPNVLPICTRKATQEEPVNDIKTGYHGMNALVPHVLEDTNEALIDMASAAVSDK